VENGDQSPIINTFLFAEYLQMAESNDSGNFSKFVVNSKYYDPKEALEMIPKGKYLYETAQVLGRLFRHEEALEIYVEDLKDFKGAEEYCENNYSRNDELRDNLFSLLYSIYHKKGLLNDENIPKYLNKNGFRMDAETVKYKTYSRHY
jgi:hypothetical protein